MHYVIYERPLIEKQLLSKRTNVIKVILLSATCCDHMCNYIFQKFIFIKNLLFKIFLKWWIIRAHIGSNAAFEKLWTSEVHQLMVKGLIYLKIGKQLNLLYNCILNWLVQCNRYVNKKQVKSCLIKNKLLPCDYPTVGIRKIKRIFL